MKKYIYYIIIVIILLIVSIVLWLKESKGTLKLDFVGFSVKDTSIVTSIQIQKDSSSVLLERKGYKWTVNQKYSANARAITKLLASISHFQVNSPVPKILKKEIMHNLSVDPIIVTIRSAGEVIKKYSIVDNKLLPAGSIMLLDESSDPYVINTAGFGGRLTGFFTTNTMLWRDRTVFHYKPDEVMAVEIVYPGKAESSFAISFLGENKALLRSVANNKITKVDINKAQQYLAGFHNVPFHWILPERVKIVNDSLSNQQPFCEIKVKNIENQINLIKGFRMPGNGKPGSFNLDKMYAVFQDDSIPVIVKYIDIDPIIKEYADFSKP